MTDLMVFESGVGGDVRLLGNDIEMTDSVFNMVYLALFGGNPEAITTGSEIESEQRSDFWGNGLLLSNDIEFQFNSTTEKTLDITALDSGGRIEIEEAVKKDLEFMSSLAKVGVDVSIISDNRVQIDVILTEPDNLTEKNFQFIWDATKSELIEEIILK